MHRDVLTELGESLREDLRTSLGIGDNGSDLAELDRDIQGLWESVVQQFEALSARLMSAAAMNDLPDAAAPMAADDVSEPGKQPGDRPALWPADLPPRSPRASHADPSSMPDLPQPVYPAEHPSEAPAAFRAEPPADSGEPQHLREFTSSSAPDTRPDALPSQGASPPPFRGFVPESSMPGVDFTRPEMTQLASQQPPLARSTTEPPDRSGTPAGHIPMPPIVSAPMVTSEPTIDTRPPVERAGIA
ncbi:MAG: hypothetical protein EHM39_01685, partial [Chloroflexi bacterium]